MYLPYAGHLGRPGLGTAWHGSTGLTKPREPKALQARTAFVYRTRVLQSIVYRIEQRICEILRYNLRYILQVQFIHVFPHPTEVLYSMSPYGS